MSRVLFCEDDAMIRKVIVLAMRESIHTLLFALDGVEGLAIARRELPDLIVSDLFMPNLDGFGLATALRADPRTAAIPLVFLSAGLDEERMTEADRYGAVRILTKPFTLAGLRAHIDEITGTLAA